MSDEYGQEWSQAPAAPQGPASSSENAWTEGSATSGEAWYQEGDSDADAASDLRLKSDFEVQVLGADPYAAAAAWPTLTDLDKVGVTAAMAAVFGVAFAQEFVVTPTDLSVDQDDIRNVAGLDTALASGDIITIMPAVSGG